MHAAATEELEAVVALNEALSSLAFPIGKADAIRRIGRVELPLPAHERIMLGDLLAALPSEALRDPRTAAKALDRSWERVARTLASIDEAEQAVARRP